jgi:cytochrome d ubiquinol oxidase subunit II
MTLQTTWFLLWGLLWAIFFMTSGFDFGVGTLLPCLGKTDDEKRIMINAIGPTWNGNEVWLLTAGGVTFAAFPKVYAVMFSSLYSALMLILFALILRGVAFEFRSKVENVSWRQFWDGCIFAGSLVPAVLFGVAFANIFKGIPIDQNGIYQGNLLTLLNPYGLCGGILFLLLFLQHGALWLSFKTENDLQQRAIKTADRLWPVVLAAAVVFLVYSKFATPLYDNYLNRPVLFLVILVTVAALAGVKFYLKKECYGPAWIASAVTIVGATFYGVIGLFPCLFPSSIDPSFSLTAFNSSSSPLTLTIMLGVVVVFVPIVLAYQAWSYNLFKSKTTAEDLAYEDAY